MLTYHLHTNMHRNLYIERMRDSKNFKSNNTIADIVKNGNGKKSFRYNSAVSEALYTEHTAASETLHIRPLFNLQTVLDRLRCVVALVVYSIPHLGLLNSIVLLPTCILNTHYGVTSRLCAFLFNMTEKTNFTQSYYTLLFVAS